MTFENGHASGRPLGEINVTPMIDVLLVLLIIFMVIAPMMPHGLSANLPQRLANKDLRPESPIIVQVVSARNEPPSYKINQDVVTIDDLAGRLSAIFSVRADKVMFVKADGNLDFSTIARVMDIGRGAGAVHVGLLTSKDPL